MTLWGRRLILFALVLAAGLLGAHTARHLTTAHASTGAAVHPSTENGQRAEHALPDASPAAAAGETLVEVAAVPPAINRAAPGVLSAEAPRAPEAPRNSMAASSAAAAAIKPLPATMHTYHDKSYKISFDYPANWTFTQKDHEISTFRLDARTADRRATLRAVTALPENPYPASTFTGAYVYLSVTPHSNESKCAEQASAGGTARPDVSRMGGMSFAHGHDEQRHICTVERDEIYTTYRKGACYRFDLAMNNFCGGEVSGVKDVTEQELENVRTRMEAIVSTVRFDPK